MWIPWRLNKSFGLSHSQDDTLERGNMKNLLELHIGLILDQYKINGLDAQRDIATIMSRVEKEGLSFLTVTLPAYYSSILRSFEAGHINSNVYRVSKRTSRWNAIPRLFRELVMCLFDEEGTVRHTIFSAQSLLALNQICNLLKKMEELPPQEVLDECVTKYKETDAAISASSSYDDDDIKRFRDASLVLWSGLSRFKNDMITPRHGPGAVADRLQGNRKFTNRLWTERLEEYFSASDFIIPSYRYWEELGSDLLAPGEEQPCRVTPVPKTATKARIICIEPSYMQYVQQGLFMRFTRFLDTNPVCSYSSQLPNQKLARQGSIDGTFSTIDLSEASDRVSLTLVKHMFWFDPELLGMILACRSQRAELPNGEIILLKKFASMGSALTFPIESMVFTTIIFMEWCMLYDLPINSHSYELMVGKVRVFGDDIIVPTPLAHSVVRKLEIFGLSVNHDKTFLNSAFRESCGAEWLGGVDVSMVKMRRHLPADRRQVAEVVAIVAFRNLYCQKYSRTEFVTKLDAYIRGILGEFPAGLPTTPALVRCGLEDILEIAPTGVDPKLQLPTINAHTVVHKPRESEIDGTDALLKFFVSPHQDDPKHLRFAGRPVGSRITYRKGIVL